MNEQEIKCGRTLVEYYQSNELTDKVVLAKKGVVLQNFTSFVRIFDHHREGDKSIIGEVLPMNAKKAYCKIVGELKERDAIRIPPSF